MLRRVLLSAAVAAMVVGLLVWSPVVAKKKPQLSFASVVGRDAPVLPFDFATAFAFCPRGHVATGGGTFLGAIELVTDGPTANGRGWLSDGFNPSFTSVFTHNVVVRCAKGKKGLAVKASVTRDLIEDARKDFLKARKQAGG